MVWPYVNTTIRWYSNSITCVTLVRWGGERDRIGIHAGLLSSDIVAVVFVGDGGGCLALLCCVCGWTGYLFYTMM